MRTEQSPDRDGGLIRINGLVIGQRDGATDLTGDAGHDRILVEQRADVLAGGASADQVVAGAGDDTVSGHTGLAADKVGLTALDGVDTLSGGMGNDTMIVRRGDTARGGSGNACHLLRSDGAPVANVMGSLWADTTCQA